MMSFKHMCLLALFIPIAEAWLSSEKPRPYELSLYRDPWTRACNVSSSRQVQLHKGLADNPKDVVVESSPSPAHSPGATERERIRLFAHDLEMAWRRAHLLCKCLDTYSLDDLHQADMTQTQLQTASSTPSSLTPESGNVETGKQHAFAAPYNSLAYFETTLKTKVKAPPLAIEALAESGPSSNRIDLVFFSDGYTLKEKDKFVKDAQRLADDISRNQTFDTVRPLLNFWAAFTPSKESGIGVQGVPKDTVYGLYRDGTELRGVYYDKPELANAACISMGDQCDYPILLGNDPYYGGLGGEFTVITSSKDNGPLVLRHELGHSIIDVGEEYDGGFAYFGPNAAESVYDPIPWKHWINASAFVAPGTDTQNDHPAIESIPRVERSVMPMQQYPWTMLNTSKPWTTTFVSPGNYERHLIRFSLSGIPQKEALNIQVDGVDLEWEPRAGIGMDRWHYDIYRGFSLSAGEHKITVALKDNSLEGHAQLCSIETLEFGNEEEFNANPGYYGLFPTYSENNETTYRPTNEGCLMRVVTVPHFCAVCREGLWLQLLKRVDLIDGIEESCEWQPDEEANRDLTNNVQVRDEKGHWTKIIDLKLVPLAQFRTAVIGYTESYSIAWSKDGHALPRFENQTRLEIRKEDLGPNDSIEVEVTFITEEVRKDPEGYLTSSGTYKPNKCT